MLDLNMQTPNLNCIDIRMLIGQDAVKLVVLQVEMSFYSLEQQYPGQVDDKLLSHCPLPRPSIRI